ncbi:MAG: hypothetical protein L7U72_09365 [Rubripirellula sp.]|nr:hypothetical protein [Rubripirellula sp.]
MYCFEKVVRAANLFEEPGVTDILWGTLAGDQGETVILVGISSERLIDKWLVY